MSQLYWYGCCYKRADFQLYLYVWCPWAEPASRRWNALISISTSRPGPWFLTGDFNEIIGNSEKVGGADRSENSFVLFRSFLSQCDLFDIQHSGNFLSWRGKRGKHLVHCRLDRTIVNSEWSDMFPHSRSYYLKLEISDHRPLLTIFDPTKKKPRRMLRYDRRLRSNQEVKDIVEAVWNASPEAQITSRISHCRKAIAEWSRSQYLNSRKTIERLQEELDTALSAPTADDTNISTLNLALLQAYRSEEGYWKQRSRQLWLTLGDKNIGYFHSATRARRARNRLSHIEGSNGGSGLWRITYSKCLSYLFQRHIYLFK